MTTTTNIIDSSLSLHVPSFPCAFRSAMADGSSRYAINGVEVRSLAPHDATSATDDDTDGPAVWLSATDGRILAMRRALGVIDGPPVVVPGDIISKKRKRDSVTRNGNELIGTSVDTSDPVCGNFPPCADVVPEVDADSAHVVTLSAQLLYNLARAIADSDTENLRVTLMIPTKGRNAKGKPIAVIGAHGAGVIMPCNTDAPELRCSEFNDARTAYQAACKRAG